MKKHLLFIPLLVFSLNISAQMEMDSTEIFHNALIKYSNGDEEENIVYFRVKDPAAIQRELQVADKEYYESRVKEGKRIQFRKLESYKPKKVEYVKIENGPTFRTSKYADLSELGLGSIPKNYLLHELAGGKLQIYMLYFDDYVVPGVEVDRQEQLAKIVENADIIIAKGDETGKNLEATKIDNFISDNEQIYQAYQNGEYPEVKAAYGSMLKGEAYDPLNNLDALIKIVNDYNQSSNQ
ncbi:hypothetical protein [Marivirga sp.]|uniref:hypothetical protein n=1 Tax=Marivirga sp. TaxID=2018662 RepID=UPI003DA6E199